MFKNRKIMIGVILIGVIGVSYLIIQHMKIYKNLLNHRARDIQNEYYLKNRLYRTMEEITAEILINTNINERMEKDIGYAIDTCKESNRLRSFNVYGLNNIKREVDLREYTWFTERFLENYRDGYIPMTDENRNAIGNMNKIYKKLNDINYKYEPFIRNTLLEDLIYSEDVSNAINEMNTYIRNYPREDYDYSTDIKREKRRMPPVEHVYGKVFLSEEELIIKAKKFMEGLDTTNNIHTSGGGESRYGHEDIFIGDIRFRCDSGYKIELYKRSGKVQRVEDDNWDHIEEDIKKYRNYDINISIEKAKKYIVSFLEERGFKNLQVTKSNIRGRILELNLSRKTDNYINLAATIEVELDLGNKGKIIKMDFEDYWIGMALKDNKYDEVFRNYEGAKNLIDFNMEIKDQILTGHRDRTEELFFKWRFTGDLNDTSYYIYVDSLNKDVEVERAVE
ncbi:hypothetical protein [Anaeromicrobium sediminis]|uniref:Germination protein YpeB n=1 Tax=Anaeromicrobium sediminis TaxID=1478221 RepID=A0A267MNA9_9FIRM|nr:hypothetical protein [Anaeromicrobium sediminis]PAB61069.1 hypothetical protein CCE28_01175 [Anaeromicrobium sediminis]